MIISLPSRGKAVARAVDAVQSFMPVLFGRCCAVRLLHFNSCTVSDQACLKIVKLGLITSCMYERSITS
jgi:hypothetical protein